MFNTSNGYSLADIAAATAVMDTVMVMMVCGVTVHGG